jgi:hypothetical protein
MWMSSCTQAHQNIHRSFAKAFLSSSAFYTGSTGASMPYLAMDVG